MRRRLPAGVRMYTGDDFNYAELIAGDDEGHSDALLGIFDAIAPAASAALAALGRGSDNEFFELLEPTVPLSRHIFAAPTRFYKTGVVFLACLNGLQDHFAMVGGQQSDALGAALAELFRLADKARVLADPELAVRRGMKRGAGGRTGLPEMPSRSMLSSIEPRDAPRTGLELRRDGRRLPPARRHRDLAVARPGRSRRPRRSRAHRPRQRPARHRPLPRRHVPGRHRRRAGRRRSTTTAAPSTKPRRSAPTAWCWWSAGCRARRKDIAGARKQVQRRHRRDAAPCPRRRRAARDRAAASDVRRRPRLREHARPGARHLRGAGRGRRRRDRRLPRLVGPQPRRRHRARRARSSRILAHHICDWLVPTTDLLLDRGMMGDGVIDLRGIRAMIEAAGYSARRRSRFSRATTGGSGRATRWCGPASSGSSCTAESQSGSSPASSAGEGDHATHGGGGDRIHRVLGRPLHRRFGRSPSPACAGEDCRLTDSAPNQ